MATPSSTSTPLPPRLLELIRLHWGFDALRPLQESAMQAVLARRDSLVVLPTGGGKSLCYQAPALLVERTTIVVSPLIALMKDQVDGLRECGVAAAALHSHQDAAERDTVYSDLREGKLRLLFVSPERLVVPAFQNFLRSLDVQSFAIDEAHCISHWGHDFRPEYRQLSQLRQTFPDVTLQAFTATATQQVRQDIVAQLGLKNPAVLVGSFDRPNLTYRVVQRYDVYGQILEVLKRHEGEAGIIYCIRRKDVDEVTGYLQSVGHVVAPYHAGLSPDLRRQAQDAFSEERCNIIVATVAFGMGIDRSNIRFVLHAGMPKSIEHYQQETGRAGRDGLEAECLLLYSRGDAMTWQRILEKAQGDEHYDPEHHRSAVAQVREMERFASSSACRHRSLVQYFGQKYDGENCGACDTCLGDCEVVPESTVLAQKILSCVARVQERFGVKHVAAVLKGDQSERVVGKGHDKLTTFGLLRDHGDREICDWIQQLIGQKLLVQTEDEYPILRLNEASWAVLHKQREVKLLQRVQQRRVRKSATEATAWEGVDRPLFELLRVRRLKLAEQRAVPPYVIFSDATLREMASVRPSTLEKLHQVRGIGAAKLQEFGADFLAIINKHCQENGLKQDAPMGPEVSRKQPPPTVQLRKPNPERDSAFASFAAGSPISKIVERTGRARSTVLGYLEHYVMENQPASISARIDDATYRLIAQAAEREGLERLRPIFVALEEKVPYDDIRVVVAHLRTRTDGPP